MKSFLLSSSLYVFLLPSSSYFKKPLCEWTWAKAGVPNLQVVDWYWFKPVGNQTTQLQVNLNIMHLKHPEIPFPAPWSMKKLSSMKRSLVSKSLETSGLKYCSIHTSLRPCPSQEPGGSSPSYSGLEVGRWAGTPEEQKVLAGSYWRLGETWARLAWNSPS